VDAAEGDASQKAESPPPVKYERMQPGEMGNCNCKLKDEGYGEKEFPSWSWWGWMGGKVEYQPDMIDGCVLNGG